MRQDPEGQAGGVGQKEPLMDVTALGGPYDGNTIAIDDGIRSIKFMTLPERSTDQWLEDDEIDARVDFGEVTYQVVRWYTGTTVDGNTGRMLMIVLAPDHWPHAGERPLYPPAGFRG